VLKLHGIQMSNYYSIVKMVMLEKGIDFEEVQQMPSRKDENWLTKSPMGKVPALETPDGPIAETLAILDYLEDLKPEPSLLPGSTYERARARQIALHCINHVDTASRPGLNSAVFGAPKDEAVNATLAKVVPRGMQSLGKLAVFDPWIGGENFTLADIVAANTIPLANNVLSKLCDIDLMTELPDQANDWLARVNERDSAKQIAADKG